MALRIRKDGQILCAAMHKKQEGDTYIPDSLSEIMSGATGETPILVTEADERHKKHGEWWWVGNIPKDRRIEHVRI